MSSKELAKVLHKPVIKKFEKRKVRSTFIDNICGADLADMQFMGKFNKELQICIGYSFKRQKRNYSY